jgi:hypothetical protein
MSSSKSLTFGKGARGTFTTISTSTVVPRSEKLGVTTITSSTTRFDSSWSSKAKQVPESSTSGSSLSTIERAGRSSPTTTHTSRSSPTTTHTSRSSPTTTHTSRSSPTTPHTPGKSRQIPSDRSAVTNRSFTKQTKYVSRRQTVDTGLKEFFDAHRHEQFLFFDEYAANLKRTKPVFEYLQFKTEMRNLFAKFAKTSEECDVLIKMLKCWTFTDQNIGKTTQYTSYSVSFSIVWNNEMSAANKARILIVLREFYPNIMNERNQKGEDIFKALETYKHTRLDNLSAEDYETIKHSLTVVVTLTICSQLCDLEIEAARKKIVGVINTIDFSGKKNTVTKLEDNDILIIKFLLLKFPLLIIDVLTPFIRVRNPTEFKRSTFICGIVEIIGSLLLSRYPDGSTLDEQTAHYFNSKKHLWSTNMLSLIVTTLRDIAFGDYKREHIDMAKSDSVVFAMIVGELTARTCHNTVNIVMHKEFFAFLDDSYKLGRLDMLLYSVIQFGTSYQTYVLEKNVSQLNQMAVEVIDYMECIHRDFESDSKKNIRIETMWSRAYKPISDIVKLFAVKVDLTTSVCQLLTQDQLSPISTNSLLLSSSSPCSSSSTPLIVDEYVDPPMFFTQCSEKKKGANGYWESELTVHLNDIETILSNDNLANISSDNKGDICNMFIFNLYEKQFPEDIIRQIASFVLANNYFDQEHLKDACNSVDLPKKLTHILVKYFLV